MIKSVYSDPRFNSHGFWKHIAHQWFDAGVYPGTTNPLIELYKINLVDNLSGDGHAGGKPRNIALFRKAIPPNSNMLAGVWDLIHMWQEGIDYDDSSAAGSVVIHQITGNVHVCLSFGKQNADGVTVFSEWEEQINRWTFAVPIERIP